MTRIIVVGGGPAGLMSAFLLQTIITMFCFLKKRKTWQKALHHGQRSMQCDEREMRWARFLNNVVSNPKFLYSAISAFDYNDAVAFFEDNGCKLKAERGGRVFPVSDKASDITKALTLAVKQKGVKVQLDTHVLSIEKMGKHLKFRQTKDFLFVTN